MTVLLTNMLTSQLGFFDQHKLDINGLKLIHNYISINEAQTLWHRLDLEPWVEGLSRRVQHYGYRYDYKSRRITAGLYLGPLPSWLLPLAKRLYGEGHFVSLPDQVIINDYQPAQGIALHTDCIPCFGRTVASISLGSSCVMDFSHHHSQRKASLILPPCSLLTLSDEARYAWQHGIAKRKNDVVSGVKIPRMRRISLTFRTVTL